MGIFGQNPAFDEKENKLDMSFETDHHVDKNESAGAITVKDMREKMRRTCRESNSEESESTESDPNGQEESDNNAAPKAVSTDTPAKTNTKKLDDFIARVRSIGLVESCRSGVVAISNRKLE